MQFGVYLSFREDRSIRILIFREADFSLQAIEHPKKIGLKKMGLVLQLSELKAVEPGLILAEPVLNQFGQTLLPRGVELQLRHLKVLKTWGCKTVKVKEEGFPEKEAEVSPEVLDRALARVNWRLKWEPTTNLEKEIFQLAVKRVIQKYLCS